jgi:LacI family transcriptional regulator
MVTIKDVARRANVSLATASRAVNETRSVAPEIQLRVQAAVAELGYEPNIMARSLRNGRTRTVAFEVRDITVAPLASLVGAAQEVLYRAGYALLITTSGADRERELQFLMKTANQRVDGMIATTSADDPEIERALTGLKIPVVVFDRRAVGENDAVLIAHGDGIRQAVDYLTSLGHRRIALITGPETTRPAHERLQAFKRRLGELGLELDPSLIRARSFDSEAAFMEASVLLRRSDRPTAIIAGGTSILPGIIRAVHSQGLSIPGEISVIGSADSDLASLSKPSFSVIRADYAAVGRIAAEMLLERLSGESPPASREVLFPTELIIRQSCGPAAS